MGKSSRNRRAHRQGKASPPRPVQRKNHSIPAQTAAVMVPAPNPLFRPGSSSTLPPPVPRRSAASTVPTAAPAATAVPVRTVPHPAERTAVPGPSPSAARSSTGCAGALAELDPQALAVTYWADMAGTTEPSDLAVRFTGVRTGGPDAPPEGDRFDRIAHATALPPGIGSVALTTRVRAVNSGAWTVTAAPVDPVNHHPRPTFRTQIHESTRLHAIAYGPAVRVWAWPMLVGLGAVVAVTVQSVLVARAHGNVAGTIALSLVACLLGFVGAKAWYLALHRRHPRTFRTAGACIQGFLTVALAVTAAGAPVTGLGVGTLLDLTAPAVFLGMAVGRPGCFLTGCCAGRPTTSRWGLWSSDRVLALRRVPVQLFEAVAALAIGVTAVVLVSAVEAFPGAVFVAAAAAYTLVRQWLFPFRADPHTPRGRRITMALCGVVLLADLLLIAFAQ